MSELKTPSEWLATANYLGITILDPDGWDRENFEADWAKSMSENEFNHRLNMSTVHFK